MAPNGTKTPGWVVGVQGPVVDVKFASTDELPDIYEVLETTTKDGRRLVLEVAEHLPGRWRAASACPPRSMCSAKRRLPAPGSPSKCRWGRSASGAS